MDLWIARDRNGELFMYDEKPKRYRDEFSMYNYCNVCPIDDDLFPEVTFENSPRKVELKLVKE